MAQTSTAADSAIDRKLLNKLTETQMARFREHTPASAEYFDARQKVMPGGVPSSFQLNDPWPVYIDHGRGAPSGTSTAASTSTSTTASASCAPGTPTR